MKTTTALLSLSFSALAPFVLAQEPADEPTPVIDPTVTTEAPAAAAAEAPAPDAEAPAAAKPSAEEVKTVVSYFLGHQIGQSFANEGAGPIQISDIDKEIFYRAMGDGMVNRVDSEFAQKDLGAIMNTFADILQQRAKDISDKNIAESNAFFAENGAKEGVITTASGLQYKVLVPSDGRKYDESKDAQALVTYEGRLLDGTIFDKSDEPISFPINGVVKGFAEALTLMPVGSEWEIYIPSELGYGENGPGILGNNASLIFKLKLHDFQAARGTMGNPIPLDPELLKQLQESGMQPMQ